MSHALTSFSLDNTDSTESLGSLTVSLTHRNLFGPLARLGGREELMGVMSRALTFVPEAHPNQPKWLTNLGASYGDRFRCLNELGDLERAIECMLRALTLALDGDPDQPKRLNDLGEFHGHRFRYLGDLGDLEKAMDYTRRALALTPDSHPELPRRLNNLGTFHCHRFQRLGYLEDNEKAIQFSSRALDLTPTNHPDLPKWLSSLGVSYDGRFQRLNELGDLEKAIECMSRALTLTPEGDPDQPKRLNDLGEVHGHRFQRLDDLVDLEKAMEYTHRALALTPDSHPELPRRLNNLGKLHNDRFCRLGERDDSEEAIKHSFRALELDSTRIDHPDLPKWLSGLGVSYGDRFKYLNDLGDLEKAIEYTSRALTKAPDDDPYQTKRLADLGEFHGHRFRRLGDLGDLDKAMDYTHRARALTPDDHADRPRQLNNLGMFHADRFRRRGALADSEEAIDYGSRALDLTPYDHPDLPKWLSNLGTSYGDRFKLLNELYDLEKAIECMARAVDLTPEKHPDLSHRLSNLGAAHHDDSGACPNHTILRKQLNMPKRLNDLGEFYGDRFRWLNDLGDLERAIKFVSRAVDSTPDGHPDLPKWLSSLGEALGDRFQHLGELPDLARAVDHANRSLNLTPEGHPSLPAKYSLLARLRFFQAEAMGSDLYLEDTLKSFRMASKSSAGSPGTKFKIALDWASLASTCKPLNCIEAYQTAIDLLPQYIWLGATTDQRYGDLLTAVNLAVDAAAAATGSSNYELALEWLEHARCVVWSQILRLRSPLDELQSSHPELAVRLRTVAKQLNDASLESREFLALSLGSRSPDEVGREHRRLAIEYDNLLSQARALPGFEDFLRPLKANKLVRAARNGPIVVINCHTEGCDALLILPGQDNVNYIPLPDFTQEKAERTHLVMKESRQRKGLRARGARIVLKAQETDGMENALKDLWNGIVKRVLEFLGYTNTPSKDLPYITWCLTGAATFLPIHAAGDYSQSGSKVFDYVISSYTPTLTALLSITPNSLSRDSQVLAIGLPHTPGYSSLPGVAKEFEALKAHIEDKAKCSWLIDGQATIAAVVDAIENSYWIHLACHGHQNVTAPTKSGFFLYDGTLDLAAINRRSFKNKGMAYLAACQTATGDENLPDEVIHLATGMLMTGYTSVIATMWSVMDDDAPLIADEVYGQLVKDGKLGDGQAGRALHSAVARLRDKVGEKNFSRWAPYIHIGS
ncbi:hypothetical protein OPQ81_003483 [Rhizoctonia solani]|nr:hypothetical protein OPQ81_003483 [Rhizoctonia solani]